MPTLPKPAKALIAPLGGGGDTFILSRVLTAVEARGAHATPIQLVGAPGVGRVVLPIGLIIEIDVGDTPWAGGSQSRLVSGSPPTVVVEGDTIDFTVDSPWVQWIPSYPYAKLSEVGNKPLYWSTQDALTAGSGTIKLRLYYQLYTF